MNLVNKTNRYYVLLLLVLFPIMVVVDYYVVKYFVNYEVNDVLLHESQRITYELTKNGNLPYSNYIVDTIVLPDNQVVKRAKFGDTLIYEAYADRYIPYRTYTFTTTSGSQKIKISLRHVLLEMNELILWIFGTTTLVLLVLATGLFLINKRIYRWAWSPFFYNLSLLKDYSLANKEPVRLKPSSISEFKELDTVVMALMNQVKKDFQNLKEFNENISHEIQTPLAIIRNKMILLLESKNLQKEEQQWAQAVYQEVNKLSKISKSLTLISRIENQEFKRMDIVDIKMVIENIVRNMKEIISFKDLKINMHLHSVQLQFDQVLANILFTNLIKNAVQHNQKGGYIKMSLTNERFEITNTGGISEVSTTQLFNRFEKGDRGTSSLGLGLSISQKICEIYGFTLNYDRDGQKHKFSLFFNSSL